MGTYGRAPGHTSEPAPSDRKNRVVGPTADPHYALGRTGGIMETSTEVMRGYHRVSSKIKFLEARKAMNTGPQSIRDYRRIEAVIRFLEGHAGEQPSLREAAAAVGLSEPVW